MDKKLSEKASAVLIAIALLFAGVTVGIAAVNKSRHMSLDGKKVHVSGEVELYDLNTATEEDLCKLDFIEEKTAKEIVAYRTKTGGFTCVEELDEVPGIGEKKLRAIAPYVTVK